MLRTIDLSMPIVGHSVGHVFPRIVERGEVQLLIEHYRDKHGAWTWRHVMETGVSSERIRVTQDRGINDEVVKGGSPFKTRLLYDLPIVFGIVPDQLCSEALHVKFLLAQRIIEGEFRDMQIPDGDALIDPPQWVEWSEVYQRMRQQGLWFHTQGTLAILDHVARESRLASDRYFKYLNHIVMPDYGTNEGRIAIAYFHSRW